MLDHILKDLVGEDPELKAMLDAQLKQTPRQRSENMIDNLIDTRQKAALGHSIIEIGLAVVMGLDEDFEYDEVEVKKLLEAIDVVSEFDFYKHIRVTTPETENKEEEK